MTTPTIQLEDLLDLRDELCRTGFDPGLQRVIAAHNLMLALAAQGRLSANPRAWRTWLAPVFCAAPNEQEEFYRCYEGWVQRRSELVLHVAEAEQAQITASNTTQRPDIHRSAFRQCLLVGRLKAELQTWLRWFVQPQVWLPMTALLLVAMGGWSWSERQTTLQLSGQVFSERETQPLAGAKVEFAGQTLVTDAQGHFAFTYQLSNLERWRQQRSENLTVTHDNHVQQVPTIVLHQPETQKIVLKKLEIGAKLHGQSLTTQPPDMWLKPLRIALSLFPLLLYTLWLIWRWWWRRAVLQKLPASGMPQLHELKVEGVERKLFASPRLRRLLLGLRRPRLMRVRELDVAATVRATIRQGGSFTSVYGVRRVSPEYLLLIDRASAHDEQARVADELRQRLEENGVFVEPYYFQGDARTCRSVARDEPALTLLQLAARYPEHCLLVFGDGVGFFDHFTGRPQRWLEQFAHWEQRVLLTPEAPAQWGYRERELMRRNFVLLPASAGGLAELGDWLSYGLTPTPDNSPATPFPELIEDRPQRWLERLAPLPEEIDELQAQVRAYLGPESWDWLCACAVYPQVTWDLTLYLGYWLFGGDAQWREELAERVLRLTRLPWFRHGTLPDWWRERLLDGWHDTQNEAKTRRGIERLLWSASEQPNEPITLEYVELEAQRFGLGLSAWWQRRRLFWRLRIQNNPEDPVRDYVFLHYMSGRRPKRLAVQAPAFWRQLLQAKKQSIVQPRQPAISTANVEPKEKKGGPFNVVVLLLIGEACLSRISNGLIKTAVPLYALLVFRLNIALVMGLVLIQNIVPLLLRPVFGSLADKHGKKPVFMVSLTVRTLVGLLYSVANLPLLFAVSVVRGIADSAKGPSASAMIADATNEKHIAQAYSWYTTAKSTSGGIGEALAAFVLTLLIGYYVGTQTVTANFAVLERTNRAGKQVEQVIKAETDVVNGELPGNEADPIPQKVLRVEQRTIPLKSIPIDDLPKVVENTPLRKALTVIFWLATALSLCSLLLVAFFIKEKKKEKKEKKDKVKDAAPTGMLHAPQQQPNVYSFALLGAALTVPAHMVTGEFFTILAVKLEVTTGAFGWIKIISETLVPLLFGPFFGWLADRIGAGKVIALRSIANLATSVLFWMVPWFAGTVLLGVMMGLARAIDEVSNTVFKSTWSAIAAKVSSYNLSNRSKTMGILEGGVDASDLLFPVLAGVMLQYLSLGPLMLVRAGLVLGGEVYRAILMRRYSIK